jgi:hypothetical protein
LLSPYPVLRIFSAEPATVASRREVTDKSGVQRWRMASVGQGGSAMAKKRKELKKAKRPIKKVKQAAKKEKTNPNTEVDDVDRVDVRPTSPFSS